MRKVWIFLLIAGAVGLLSHSAVAQKVEITLGPDKISQNEAWTIAITVYDSRLKTYDKFPDIKGFRKGGTATRSLTSLIQGKITSTESVIMSYYPLKTGVIDVNSFGLKINDKYVKVAGKKVTITSS